MLLPLAFAGSATCRRDNSPSRYDNITQGCGSCELAILAWVVHTRICMCTQSICCVRLCIWLANKPLSPDHVCDLQVTARRGGRALMYEDENT
jgi:hypothetical protein